MSTKEENLLTFIRAGHEIAVAARMAGIEAAELAANDDLRAKAIAEFAKLSGRLRERLMLSALQSDDVKVISSLLEKREASFERETAKVEPRQLARGFLAVCSSLGLRLMPGTPDDTVIAVPPGSLAYVVEDNELNRKLFGDPPSDLDVVKPMKPDDLPQGGA